LLCFKCGKDHGSHSNDWIELNGSSILELLENDIEIILAFQTDLCKKIKILKDATT
jgi:hypothetical protein